MIASIIATGYAGKKRVSALIFVLSLLVSCVSIERYSTGDLDAKDRIRDATSEIEIQSRDAASTMISVATLYLEEDLNDYLQRHFKKADKIVHRHSVDLKNAFPFVSFNDYVDKRKVILDYTLGLDPTVQVINSPSAGAIAFPHGKILVTRPLIEAFRWTNDGYDSALLGVLIHELLHVRDGHSIEQWSTADGRRELVENEVLGALANLTMLVPFLSIKNDMNYGTTFQATENLKKLSEFAADFGAYTLLNRNGFAGTEYADFLREVHAKMRKRDRDLSEPFSWMDDRLKCLSGLYSSELNRSIRGVAIGEEGDSQVQILSLVKSFKLLDIIDQPEKLRAHVGSSGNLGEEELKKIVLNKIRALIFLMCAIDLSFPNAQRKVGMIQVPSFDTILFTQHFKP